MYKLIRYGLLLAHFKTSLIRTGEVGKLYKYLTPYAVVDVRGVTHIINGPEEHWFSVHDEYVHGSGSKAKDVVSSVKRDGNWISSTTTYISQRGMWAPLTNADPILERLKKRD